MHCPWYSLSTRNCFMNTQTNYIVFTGWWSLTGSPLSSFYTLIMYSFFSVINPHLYGLFGKMCIKKRRSDQIWLVSFKLCVCCLFDLKKEVVLKLYHQISSCAIEINYLNWESLRSCSPSIFILSMCSSALVEIRVDILFASPLALFDLSTSMVRSSFYAWIYIVSALKLDVNLRRI